MRPPRHRAGMTFMEVVVAVALLGVVSTALFGLFSFLSASQLRQQRLLACNEVANRLMLQYLDDSTKMPDPHKVVEYGPEGKPARFRYEYREDHVQIIESLAEQRDPNRVSPLSADRFLQVTIHVWLGEESGGSRFAEGTTPDAKLSRMLDPVYPRNPDSFMNMLNDPQALQQFMKTMMGFQGGTTIRGGLPGGNNNSNQKGQSGQRPGRGQFGQGSLNPRGAFKQGGNKGGGNRFNFGAGSGRPTTSGGITTP